MRFTEFREKIIHRFDELQKTGKLYVSSVSGREIWDIYLSSFKPEDDPVFRDPESSTHNCNLDKNFIRRYGNVVAIDDNYDIMTMFDLNLDEDCEYYNSAVNISNLLKSKPIANVFFETFDELNSLPYEKIKRGQNKYRLGVKENHKIYTKEEAEKFGVVEPGKTYKFEHFYLDLDKKFVDSSGKSQEAIMSEFRDAKNVFKRGLDEIPLDTLELVKELIQQGSLLNGDTHLYKIKDIIPHKKNFDSLSGKYRDNYSWIESYRLPIAKFKNELIGVLCSDLAEGVELNKACLLWNKRVDPANYMKAVAPITETQIKRAKQFAIDNGYEESFNRRFATIDDIDVSEIIHVNSETEEKTASLFDSVKPTKSTRHKKSKFDDVEEVSIEKFMKDILPTCSSVEVLLENKFENNLVTMTTAKDKESKPIFKWSNNYSWTYKGNLAGKSQIKTAVKSRGGKVDGDLRCSMHFPKTTDDYDLHMVQPDRSHIYYSSHLRKPNKATGMLDLDAQGVDGAQSEDKRVENIIYSDKNKMPKGNYKLYVNNYSGRGFKVGFKIEIEFDGEITLLELRKPLTSNNVDVAVINFDGENFTLTPAENMELISSNTISKEIWGLKTNEFKKVNLVCLSPNHWGENNVGNKHYFFMMDGCYSDEPMRSFHNENLNSDLLKHRKVMEVLGETNKLNPTKKQLAGLGFNSTVKNELILKLSGTFKRVIKVKIK